MTARPAGATSGGRSTRWLPTLWLQGLACGAAATLATPSAVFAAIALAPGLVAAALDGGPGRPAARAALLCGIAAAAMPVADVWKAGQDVGGALELASDPGVIGLCWAAQAGAWLLAQLIPLLLRLALEAGAAARAAGLRAERARYQAEWGIPPVGRTPT